MAPFTNNTSHAMPGVNVSAYQLRKTSSDILIGLKFRQRAIFAMDQEKDRVHSCSAKPGDERVSNFCQVCHRLRGSTSARIANQTNSEVLRGTACGNSRSLLRDAQTLLPIL